MFSAIFKLDNKGKVIEEWFGKTVINSDHRFTTKVLKRL
jgi:ribonuclease R